MTKRDLVTVALSALATMGVSLALVGTMPAVATGGETAALTVKTPTLKAGGVELSLLFPDSEKPAANGQFMLHDGEVPAMQLAATNPTDADIEVPYKVEVNASEPPSPGSRVWMNIQRKTWEYSSTVKVKAGTTAIVTLEPKGTIKKGAQAWVTLASGGVQITAAGLAAPAVTLGNNFGDLKLQLANGSLKVKAPMQNLQQVNTLALGNAGANGTSALQP